MTEKRYSLVYYADKGGAFIKNNKNGIEWYHDSRASLLEIVDELNGLAEENELIKQENKELKEINQDNQDYISSLEEKKNNLQIKLQKIRDYAIEDGEVKQGVIEKVILND